VTVHARGYRRHEQGFAAKGPRFLPILAEGYAEAVRGKAFRRLTLLFLLTLMVHAVLLYMLPDRALARIPGIGSPAVRLRIIVGFYISSTTLFVPLLALFVGSGLVAEDLRTRALPLYLTRPVTALDYWLGKLLVPVSVVGVSYGGPLLALVLFGVLLRPSAEMLPFLLEQGPLFAAVLAHVAACALAYGSLVLFASTVAGRRLPALILGAAVVYGGDVARMSLAASDIPHTEALGAVSLAADLRRVFHAVTGESQPFGSAFQPDLVPALAAIALVVALGAWVVLRRARTAEVVA
jgi:hypothetical protein